MAPSRSPPVGRTAYNGSAACGDGRGPASTCAGRRRGPVGAATDEVLVGHIRRVREASPFHGEGSRKAWAKLRVERIRTSQERVRRLMREHGLQAPYRAGHAHGPKAHDGTITTAAPNVMWGTDMTSTVTVGEGAACVFVAVDGIVATWAVARGRWLIRRRPQFTAPITHADNLTNAAPVLGPETGD